MVIKILHTVDQLLVLAISPIDQLRISQRAFGKGLLSMNRWKNP
jgi:hypothetical protein